MRKQGSYLAFLLNQQLYQRWYAKLICVLICVFESLRLVPGHLSVCCPTVAWQGAPGTAMVLINELMGGQGGGSPHGLGDCSPTTQGLSAPVGEAHCLCRGNRGQQPPTNQSVIPPAAWDSSSACLEISSWRAQTLCLSRKVWKPSSLTLPTQDPLLFHLPSKWHQSNEDLSQGLRSFLVMSEVSQGRQWECWGSVLLWGKLIALTLRKAGYDLALKQKVTWGVPSGYLLGMS